MRHPRLVLVLALAILAAPTVAAGPQPALYFMRDDTQGAAAPGVLAVEPPESQEPSVRPVPAATDAVVPVQFVAIDSAERPRGIRGPLFMGLWTDASATIDANLSATLYESVGGQLTPLSSTSINLKANASKAPNATSLVPPNPSDPQGSVLYEVAQVTPMVITPASLLFLGQVDLTLAEGSELLVGFRLINASGAAAPVPQGAFATLRYDAQLSPSYVFVPYWEPDPPSTFTPRPPATTSRSSAAMTSDTQEAEGGSPSPTAILVIAALAAAVVVARRRR